MIKYITSAGKWITIGDEAEADYNFRHEGEEYALDVRETKLLVAFCKSFFEKALTFVSGDMRNSSYLSQAAKSILGLPVGNADIKRAMSLAGFLPKNPAVKDWDFMFSNASPAMRMLKIGQSECFGKALTEYLEQ